MGYETTLFRKHRSERLEKGRFKLLIETPEVLAGGASPIESGALVLPYSCILGVSFSTIITSGQLAVNTSTGRILGTIGLAADTIQRLGYFERGVSITIEPTVSLPGVASLHYLDQWKIPFVIATATFT